MSTEKFISLGFEAGLESRNVECNGGLCKFLCPGLFRIAKGSGVQQRI